MTTREKIEHLKGRLGILENQMEFSLDIMKSERAKQFEKWSADNKVDNLVEKKVKNEIEFKVEDMVEIAAREEVDSRLEDWKDEMQKYFEGMIEDGLRDIEKSLNKEKK